MSTLPISFPKAYSELVSDAATKHLLRNWSGTEIGIRHPNGPIGLVCRDQGQVDIYSGRTRAILSIDGKYLNLAKNFTVVSEIINLVSKDITSLLVRGKYFNPILHDGEKVLVSKVASLESYQVIGPRTRWDERTQTFIDTIPLTDLVQLEPVFIQPEQPLPNKESEVFKIGNQLLGIKLGR